MVRMSLRFRVSRYGVMLQTKQTSHGITMVTERL